MSKIKKLLPEDIEIADTLEPDLLEENEHDAMIGMLIFTVWTGSKMLMTDSQTDILSSDEIETLEETVNALQTIIDLNKNPF